ncbi:MAG: DNA polymerase III subunit delta' [Deltaproteobacteria bacterium HGW-Deltaproteobacteria-6]|nr:MAG: DNA polymerase III subunit delta' [Deltaproteobacteria bacterium HGW-Deltaproteobacteria-6]
MSFKNIYGHQKQIGMLQKAMALSRVGHSYIFSGLDAIGKKALALAFTQALTCENASSLNDACGNCPSCRKMASGNHPDIHLVETQAQFIRIDAIRNIQQQMTFKPLEGQRRVFIIDDADKMNEQAANALLKTLEEPSHDNIIMLVTARPYWLPQTILSRCRHVRMNPLTAETVATFLIEQRQMNPSKALLLASLSGGSIGQALELNSEDMIAFRTELSRILTAAGRKDPLSLLTLASFLGQDKKEIRQGLRILNTYFRDALVYKETAQAAMIINADDLPAIASLAGRLGGEQILQNIALVDKSNEAIEMNVNKSLTLEAMAFKLHL